MQQPLGAGENLDECAERGDFRDLPEILLAHFGGGRDRLDPLDGPFASRTIGRRHADGPGVVNVDLCARFFLEALDDLSSGPDEIANLGLRNLDLRDLRCMVGKLLARRFDRGDHLVQDLEASLPRLFKCALEHLQLHVGLLDVHLERGNAGFGAGHLEVHVAVVVLRPGDVGQHHEVVVLGDQAHGDSRDRSLDRHTGIHQRQRAAADGRHGAGAVRFQNVADDADGVGKILVFGHDRREGALGQQAVADLASACASHEARLADAERREVVVDHEVLLIVRGFDPLLALAVGLGPQSRRHHGLGLAAREHRGTMRSCQLADLAGDRPDLVRSPVVGAPLQLEDLLAEQFLLPWPHERRRLGGLVRVPFVGCPDLRLQGPEQGVALELRVTVRVKGLLGLLAPPRLDLVADGLVDLRRLNLAFGLSGLGHQLFDRPHDLHAALVAAPNRLDHAAFVGLVRVGLDHYDSVHGRRHRDVDVRLGDLFVVRIQDPFVLPDAGHAHRTRRDLHRDVGNGDRRRRSRHRVDAGVVIGGGRHDERDDLRLVREAVGEERPQRPVDHAAGDRFLFRGPSLALDVAAGETSGRVRVLPVVHGQREEPDALPRLGRGRGRNEHLRVAAAHDDSSARLFRQTAGLERDGLSVQLEFNDVFHDSCCPYRPAAHAAGGQASPRPRGRTAWFLFGGL